MKLRAGNAAKEKLIRMCKLAKQLGEHFSTKKLTAVEEYTIEMAVMKAVEQEFRRGLAKRYKIKQ